jgi:hypothetical protein
VLGAGTGRHLENLPFTVGETLQAAGEPLGCRQWKPLGTHSAKLGPQLVGASLRLEALGVPQALEMSWDWRWDLRWSDEQRWTRLSTGPHSVQH